MLYVTTGEGRGGKGESRRITVKTFPVSLCLLVSPHFHVLPCLTGSVPVSYFLFLPKLSLPYVSSLHHHSFWSEPLSFSLHSVSSLNAGGLIPLTEENVSKRKCRSCAAVAVFFSQTATVTWTGWSRKRRLQHLSVSPLKGSGCSLRSTSPPPYLILCSHHNTTSLCHPAE